MTEARQRLAIHPRLKSKAYVDYDLNVTYLKLRADRTRIKTNAPNVFLCPVLTTSGSTSPTASEASIHCMLECAASPPENPILDNVQSTHAQHEKAKSSNDAHCVSMTVQDLHRSRVGCDVGTRRTSFGRFLATRQNNRGQTCSRNDSKPNAASLSTGWLHRAWKRSRFRKNWSCKLEFVAKAVQRLRHSLACRHSNTFRRQRQNTNGVDGNITIAPTCT